MSIEDRGLRREVVRQLEGGLLSCAPLVELRLGRNADPFFVVRGWGGGVG